MVDVVSPSVGSAMLSAWDLLETPVAVVRIGNCRPVWANRSAMALWGMESLDKAKSPLPAGLRPAIEELLAGLAASQVPGYRRTIALADQAGGDTEHASVTCTKVRFDGYSDAVLLEFHRSASAMQPTCGADRPFMMASPGAAGVTAAVKTDEFERALVEFKGALEIERDVRRRQRKMLEIASHEFRTPLAVIDGAAQRIERSAGIAPPERIQELARRVREFVTRLDSVLTNTLERVRKNEAEIDFRPEFGQIGQVIARVVVVFEDLADIELDGTINDLPDMWFDRMLIEQAFSNLIENAIKYSVDRARIRISAKVAEDSVELSVRDWGIGILPEERERVFAESVRGRNVGQRVGTGLGLYIVAAIVRAHGGEISAVETEGPGATLKLVLPIRPNVSSPPERRGSKS